MRIKEQRKRKKRRRIGICIFLVVLMLFALAALIVVKVFTVQNVVVEGNSLYSADQIKNMVLDDDYSWNSLYVDLKYRFVDVGEVPFVDTMEISLDDPHTLRISVTEKGILGRFYIDTLGQYAYFDKDGFVVETSSDVIEGVPKITGVTCDSVVLYEKLPLEDTKLLRNLLTLTQLLKKYELEPEEIHYDSAMQPQLTYGTIAVNVGSEDYLTQTIYIKVTTDVRDYFSKYDISGSSDKIASLQYYNEGGNGVIAISMNRLYEFTYKLENGALYMDFIDPHDIYDKVIVIDAGHGSRMSGATKNGIQEKDINLDIVLQLKALFDAYDGNIGVYYTRTDDSNPTLQQRAELANKAGADLFISVHNNSSGTGNFTSVNGTQVLYSESDDRELGSKKLAQICLDNVTAATGSNDFGLLKADDIYIVRSSEAPVALIEVGFMTNRDELAKLADPEYQKTAAQGIFNAVLEAVKEGY